MLKVIKSVVRLPGFAPVAAALLFAGCQSYAIVQRNMFADDRGNLVVVDYGRSESDHVNTYKSPVNGEELEFKSKLMVRAELPDGDSFKAWQCMNFLPYGTMYRSDNERWMLHANGFTCVIYRQTEEDETRYLEVYRGVLCDIDKDVRVKKDDRWKDVTNAAGAYKKPASEKK